MTKEISNESKVLLEKIELSNKNLGYKPSMLTYRGGIYKTGKYVSEKYENDMYTKVISIPIYVDKKRK